MRQQSFAWVDHGSVRYLVTTESPKFAVQSAVLRLINGVFETCGHESFRVLRTRMHSSNEPTEFERAAIKLAAKRIQFSAQPPCPLADSQLIDLSSIPMNQPNAEHAGECLGSALDEPEAIELCRTICAQIKLSEHRYESPRLVSAILLGPDKKLLGAAVNSNELNRFRHAEVNLVTSYFDKMRGLIPAGSTVITSLSPCRMCAHLLAAMSEDGLGIRVVSLQQDQGRLGHSPDLKNQLILA